MNQNHNNRLSTIDYRLSTNGGQTLLEMVAALGVAVIIIVALSIVIVRSIRSTQVAKNQSIATKLTEESIESVRTVRDQLGWQQFATYTAGSGTCYRADLATPALVTTTCPELLSGELSQFSRKINLLQTGVAGQENTHRAIEVEIIWQDPSGQHNSKARTILTDWQTL
ncbi:MAG TPA: hypothetical protein VIK81_03720 [Patescibacteria group bacterium]